MFSEQLPRPRWGRRAWHSNIQLCPLGLVIALSICLSCPNFQVGLFQGGGHCVRRSSHRLLHLRSWLDPVATMATMAKLTALFIICLKGELEGRFTVSHERGISRSNKSKDPCPVPSKQIAFTSLLSMIREGMLGHPCSKLLFNGF